MKKLSLILVLIMTLSLMVGALTTIAFAAGDGTEANPITVGGEGADYATVAEALAAAATAEGTTYIKLTGSTTETTAAITVAKNVVIYSDATGDARPTITLAADASIGTATYGYWVMVDGAELTFKGVQIDTSALITAKNATAKVNAGSIIPKNGAKVSVIDSVATNGGDSGKDGGFFYFCDNAHYGDIVIDNSTITSANRGIHFGKSVKTSSVTLINGAILESTGAHGIQASAITTAELLTIKVIDSTIKTPSGKVGMYNRALKADIELVNATITAGTQVIDARNDKATLNLTVVGGTFAGADLVKFKSPTAVINLIGADVAGVTTLINNELSSENITINTYGVTGTNANVPAEKIVVLDKAGANALLEASYAGNDAVTNAAKFIIDGWKYDADTKTYSILTPEGYVAAVNDINTNKNGAATIKLVADLDMTGVDVPVICLDNTVSGYFSGTFDGNGHTISNMVIEETVTRVGIVGQVAGATFKNLTVKDSSVKGAAYTSLFIGDARSTSNPIYFENCHAKNVKVESTGNYVAGFVTTNTSPVTIKNCTIDAQLVTADGHAGFLVNERSSDKGVAVIIENVVVTGTIASSGDKAVTNGGVIGIGYDDVITMTNVVSNIKFTNVTNAGALVGNAKRASLTATNVICVGTPVAVAESLGEKAANNYVLNNVFVLGNEAGKIFGKVTLNAANASALTIDGVAADFETATVAAIPANTVDAAAAKIAEFFTDAAIKDAAIAAVPHICAFNQENADDKFIADKATCTTVAKYYVSCVCGEKGTDTFEYGDVLPHTYEDIAGDEYLVTPAGCTTSAVFYKSCKCGAVSEETFTAIGVLGHYYGEWTTVVEPTVDAEGVKEQVCLTCGDKKTAAIEKLPAPEPEAPVEEPSFLGNIANKVVATKDKVAGAMGCGGSIGGASIIIMIAAAGAVIARKKKED